MTTKPSTTQETRELEPCPVCAKEFATALGLGVHKYRAHGLSGDRDTLAYRRNYWRKHSKQKQRYTASWRKRNPLKRKAHSLVAQALTRGTLHRPSHCEECGAEKFVYAHHDDYFKPLVVRWLCPDCHRKHHRDEGACTLQQTEDPWPNDLIAFKWANTLSTAEQNVLLAHNVKRLQSVINVALQVDTEQVIRLRAAIENEAARRAYAAGLGVSEWEAFLWPEARAALQPKPETELEQEK